MYRFSKVLGPLSVRSTIQLCHRQPPSLSLSSSSSSAAAAAAARWVTTINRKSCGNLDQCGNYGGSDSHNTSIVDHQIRLFSGQTAESKKKTKNGQKRKKRKRRKKKVGKYGHQSMIEFQRKWDKLELKRLKNLSHQDKLNEILSRCDKLFKVYSDEYDMEYELDYDLRQELMQSKGWVRVQSVLSHSEFKHWCNADLFMEALASHDGLDQCDVIYNRKVVETVELNKNRQYWQKLKRKQLKIKQVKKSEEYIWNVRLEWVKDDYKKYVDTELDELKKERIRLALTNLPVSTETSLSLTSLSHTSMAARQKELERERNMIDSLTINNINGKIDIEILEHNKDFERCLDEYLIHYDIHLTKKQRKDLQPPIALVAARQIRLERARNMIGSLTSLDGHVEYDEQTDDEICAQNNEFERCLDEYMSYFDIHLTKKEKYMSYFDIHLTKKEKKDLQRLNHCERIDKELEELPSELVNDDISSSDPNYALMRHSRVTKEYLDILRDIDEYEDDDDLFESH